MNLAQRKGSQREFPDIQISISFTQVPVEDLCSTAPEKRERVSIGDIHASIF
jgi:hypothetical protein